MASNLTLAELLRELEAEAQRVSLLSNPPKNRVEIPEVLFDQVLQQLRNYQTTVTLLMVQADAIRKAQEIIDETLDNPAAKSVQAIPERKSDSDLTIGRMHSQNLWFKQWPEGGVVGSMKKYTIGAPIEPHTTPEVPSTPDWVVQGYHYDAITTSDLEVIGYGVIRKISDYVTAARMNSDKSLSYRGLQWYRLNVHGEPTGNGAVKWTVLIAYCPNSGLYVPVVREGGIAYIGSVQTSAAKTLAYIARSTKKTNRDFIIPQTLMESLNV